MTANDRPAEPISPLRDRGRPDMGLAVFEPMEHLAATIRVLGKES